jgi:hypothetical protein
MIGLPPSWTLVAILGVLCLALGLLLPVSYSMGERAEAGRQEAADKALAEAYRARVAPIAEEAKVEQTAGANRLRDAIRSDMAAAGAAQRVIEATADEDAAYRDAVRPAGPHAERLRAIERAAAAGSDSDPVQR